MSCTCLREFNSAIGQCLLELSFKFKPNAFKKALLHGDDLLFTGLVEIQITSFEAFPFFFKGPSALSIANSTRAHGGAAARFSLGAGFRFLNVVQIRLSGAQLHRERGGYDRPRLRSLRAAGTSTSFSFRFSFGAEVGQTSVASEGLEYAEVQHTCDLRFGTCAQFRAAGPPSPERASHNSGIHRKKL